jgi:hypothetical protein
MRALVSEWLHTRTLDTKKTRVPRSIHTYLFETRVRSTYLQVMQGILRLAHQHPGQRYVVYPAAFPREYICFYTDHDVMTAPASGQREVNLYIDYPDPTAPEDMPPLLYTCSPRPPEDEQDLLAILLEWKTYSHGHAFYMLNRYLDIDCFDPLDPDMNLVCTVYHSSLMPSHHVFMEIAIPGTLHPTSVASCSPTRIPRRTSV